jgi:hypothetical protein
MNRTALVGGSLLAILGLIVRLATAQPETVPPSTNYGGLVGTLMLIIGVLVAAVALFDWARAADRKDKGDR